MKIPIYWDVDCYSSQLATQVLSLTFLHAQNVRVNSECFLAAKRTTESKEGRGGGRPTYITSAPCLGARH